MDIWIPFQYSMSLMMAGHHDKMLSCGPSCGTSAWDRRKQIDRDWITIETQLSPFRLVGNHRKSN